MGDVIRGWNFSQKKKDLIREMNYFKGEMVNPLWLRPGKRAWFTVDVTVLENLVTGEITVIPEEPYEGCMDDLFRYVDFYNLWDWHERQYSYNVPVEAIGKRPCL